MVMQKLVFLFFSWRTTRNDCQYYLGIPCMTGLNWISGNYFIGEIDIKVHPQTAEFGLYTLTSNTNNHTLHKYWLIASIQKHKFSEYPHCVSYMERVRWFCICDIKFQLTNGNTVVLATIGAISLWIYAETKKNNNTTKMHFESVIFALYKFHHLMVIQMKFWITMRPNKSK